MAYEENLTRLEKIIETLLDKLDRTQQDKSRLENELHLKEKECVDLKAELAEIRQDKEKIHARVTGLIDSIEKWESRTGGKTSGAPPAATTPQAEPDSNQKKLFRSPAMAE